GGASVLGDRLGEGHAVPDAGAGCGHMGLGGGTAAGAGGGGLLGAGMAGEPHRGGRGAAGGVGAALSRRRSPFTVHGTANKVNWTNPCGEPPCAYFQIFQPVGASSRSGDVCRMRRIQLGAGGNARAAGDSEFPGAFVLGQRPFAGCGGGIAVWLWLSDQYRVAGGEGGGPDRLARQSGAAAGDDAEQPRG